MIDYRSKTQQELERLMESWGESAFRGRQLFRWLWKPTLSGLDEISEMSKSLRARLVREGFLYDLDIVARQVSSSDTTCKWAFKLFDGSLIETVLIPGDTHTTLCVSSQVGCAMGCTFCKTGSMGFFRNLYPSEIAGQVLAVMKDTSKELWPRNIVYMGMGEPLANFDNVVSSIKILTNELGLNFSKRRITVSTCGVAPLIPRLGKEVDVGLAISLHATTDDLRSRIMPINKRYPLKDLMVACKQFELPKRRRITFEYIVLGGVNHFPDDAKRLAGLIESIPSKINLIAYNEVDGLDFRPPTQEELSDFQALLVKKGFTAIIRKSKGRDIDAACGQLWSNFSKKDKNRKSALVDFVSKHP